MPRTAVNAAGCERGQTAGNGLAPSARADIGSRGSAGAEGGEETLMVGGGRHWVRFFPGNRPLVITRAAAPTQHHFQPFIDGDEVDRMLRVALGAFERHGDRDRRIWHGEAATSIGFTSVQLIKEPWPNVGEEASWPVLPLTSIQPVLAPDAQGPTRRYRQDVFG